MRFVLLALLFMLAGCAATPPLEAQRAPAGWRAIATQDDRNRIRNWRTAWVEALASARRAGHGAEISGEGALLEPDTNVPFSAPSPGEYRCRVIKVGAKGEGLLNYIAYPQFTCRIGLGERSVPFTKVTGSQRQIGNLYPDERGRMIFLGTLQLGDEREVIAYGRDRERDVAGVLDRIGEQRWRIAFPYPHFESQLDVLELIPA